MKIQSNRNSSNPDSAFTMAGSDSSRKQIFREIFLLYHEIVCCVHSLESPHRGDSNECTIIVKKIEKISLNYRHVSNKFRTNFHNPNDVRAIEVRLFISCYSSETSP